MKHRLFLRWIAALLVLTLLPIPVPTYAAEDELRAVAIPYCRLFSDYTGVTELWIDNNGAYYMTMDAAVNMLGLHLDGNDYVTQNGYIRLHPDPYDLPYKTIDIFCAFPLAGLMDELQAYAFVNSDGVLCVNTVADNLDRLMVETERILANGAYSADLLNNMEATHAGTVLTMFATLYDVIWNMRFNALWGTAQDEDYQALLLDILRPAGSPDNLLDIMANRAKTLNQTATTILGADDYGYEALCEALGETIPGEGRLLFGEAGTAPFRELLEGIKAVDSDETLSLQDYLKIGAQLFEVEQISSLYADALGSLLDQVGDTKDTGWLSFTISPLYRNGKSVLQSYARYREDEQRYLIKDGVSMVVTEYLKNYAEGEIKDALLLDPAGKIMRTAINLFDNYALQINKKNSAVLKIAAASDLQKDFMKMYALVKDSDAPLTTRATLLQSAIILYLRTAWESYDAITFDNSIAGAAKRVQALLEEELSTIMSFTDAMFFYQGNTPIAPGSFGENEPTALPTGNEALFHEQYRTFLRHYEWLIDAGLELDNVDDFYALYLGSYCYYDMDKDGIDELLVLAELSMADSAFLVYKGSDSGVTLLGQSACQGGSNLYGYTKKNGVVLSSAHQGIGIDSTYTLSAGTLTLVDINSFSIPDGSSYPLPDGTEIINLIDIREITNAPSTWQSSAGDAFEIAPLNGRFTFTVPGEWDGYYFVEDGEMASTVYCLAPSGERYPLFTLWLTGHTDAIFDLPYYRVISTWGGDFLAIATWDYDYRAILAQPDRQIREQYWTMVESLELILPYIQMH